MVKVPVLKWMLLSSNVVVEALVVVGASVEVKVLSNPNGQQIIRKPVLHFV